LNEECVRPQGSGTGFVNKALAANKKSPCLVLNKTDQLSFGVIHYAGKVFYEASNFVEGNKDTLSTDLEDAATKCSNSIIADAFNYEKYHAAAVAANKKGRPARQKSNIMAPTVWTKYKTQLSSLMKNLYATKSRYIRCIKPNTVKKPLIMEHKTSVEQLRYAGIVAGVTISRSAFPNRLNNSVVYARYNSMWDKKQYPAAKTNSMTVFEKVKADCDAILTCALKSKEITEDGKTIKAFVVGKTRTYFRGGALEFLESQRITGLDAQAIAIQKAARGYLVRRYQVKTSRVSKEDEEAARLEEEERLERLKREKAENEAKLKKRCFRTIRRWRLLNANFKTRKKRAKGKWRMLMSLRQECRRRGTTWQRDSRKSRPVLHPQRMRWNGSKPSSMPTLRSLKLYARKIRRLRKRPKRLKN